MLPSVPCTFTFVLCTTSHTRTDATHIDDFDTQVIALFALEAPHKRHQRGKHMVEDMRACSAIHALEVDEARWL